METQNTAQNPTQNPTQAAPDAAQQESNDLNISDLQAMKMIIDVASQRGAFKPGEMVAVGQTYNKLTNFLASVQKGPQQNG